MIETKNIHSHPQGFLKDAVYISDLLNLLLDYQSKFGEAKYLDLYLNEIPAGRENHSSKELFEFSTDGSAIKINIFERQFTNGKEKITSKPTAHAVYQSIIFALNKAVTTYAEKFPL